MDKKNKIGVIFEICQYLTANENCRKILINNKEEFIKAQFLSEKSKNDAKKEWSDAVSNHVKNMDNAVNVINTVNDLGLE